MVTVRMPGGTRGGGRAGEKQSVIQRGVNSRDGSEGEVGVIRMLGVVNSHTGRTALKPWAE